MLEAHGEGYTCTEHCGRKFDKKKYLNSHLARVKARSCLRQRKLYMFDQESGELNSDSAALIAQQASSS